METTTVTPEASVESYVTDQDIPFLLLSLVLKTCTTRSNDKREVTHRRFSLLFHCVSATGCRLRLYLLPSNAIANSILEPSFDRIFNDEVPSVTFNDRRPGFLHLDRSLAEYRSSMFLEVRQLERKELWTRWCWQRRPRWLRTRIIVTIIIAETRVSSRFKRSARRSTVSVGAFRGYWSIFQIGTLNTFQGKKSFQDDAQVCLFSVENIECL